MKGVYIVMPSTITHEYYYRDVYDRTNNTFKNTFDMETYRKYSLFAQGHDAFLFLNFWNLFQQRRNFEKVNYMQDHDFKDICLELIQLIRTYGLEDSKELKLMLYGFIMHHILDSTIHPYIIYEAEKFGLHAAVESYLDRWMIEKNEESNPKKYPVHKIIPTLPEVEPSTIQVINEAFFHVYHYRNFGSNYIKALHQVNPFLYLFRYDPMGIKKIGYHMVDQVYPTDSKYFWLSYHNQFEGYSQYLNDEHRVWMNPVDSSIVSTESFVELYERAILESVRILNDLEEAIRNDARFEDFEKIIPDVSAIHGQKCNQDLKFKYLRR